MKRIRLAALASILLAGSAVPFLFRSGFNDREHEGFQGALEQLKQLDTRFNEDLTKARYSLLSDYDGFIDNQQSSAAALSRLEDLPDFVDPAARNAIRGRVADMKMLLARRSDFLERFKSQNAIVANSQRYLPFAIEELRTRRRRRPDDGDLLVRLDDLTFSLWAAEVSEESDRAVESQEALGSALQLQEWAAGHPGHSEAAMVSSLVLNARTLVSGTERLDDATRALLDLPTSKRLDEIAHAYEGSVGVALKRAQQYRALLYVLGSLLLATGLYCVYALRTINRRLEQRVAERTADLGSSERRFRALAEAAPVGIFLSDASRGIVYSNRTAQQITGLSAVEILGEGWMKSLHPDEAAELAERWRNLSAHSDDRPHECRFCTPAGLVRTALARVATVRDDQGLVLGWVATLEDITARLRIAAELHQAQKLESVGRLAAGVAHEINTPLQFVNDSCHFVRDALGDLARLLAEYRRVVAAVAGGSLDPGEAEPRLRAAEDAADAAYLLANMPPAMERSLEGLQRVTTIVRSMKEFAHPDQREKAQADLNHAILGTLTIARNEYKDVAEVRTELGELPPVPCFLGDFNQVILNLVINAAHAIEDVVRDTGRQGLITVRTFSDGGNAVIEVEDDGSGIPDAIRDRIFDPFFTTKAVGRGTGQGLAIARAIVVDRHRGALEVRSAPRGGTIFTIRLPLAVTAASTMQRAA